MSELFDESDPSEDIPDIINTEYMLWGITE